MSGFIDPLYMCTGMQEKHLGHARIEIKLYHLEKKMHISLIPQHTKKPNGIHMGKKIILISIGFFLLTNSRT